MMLTVHCIHFLQPIAGASQKCIASEDTLPDIIRIAGECRRAGYPARLPRRLPGRDELAKVAKVAKVK